VQWAHGWLDGNDHLTYIWAGLLQFLSSFHCRTHIALELPWLLASMHACATEEQELAWTFIYQVFDCHRST
jgi:hypothetical protein